jgi:hypothetical protein
MRQSLTCEVRLKGFYFHGMEAVAALTLEEFDVGGRGEKGKVRLPFQFAAARRTMRRVIVVD